MGDDPPYLTVGTEVSAKYKGAFCEAKIRKVVRVVKCKVTFKSGLGGALLSDDLIKGSLRVGANVEAKHSEKNQFCEATINKIQDCSQYTVVFDDGDITTLRRSALCLKSGRHFNESETLDQLPLTHPEHFSNPVVGGRRGVRRRAANNDAEKDDSSDEEESPSQKGKKKGDNAGELGKVVYVEISEKKKGKDNWFPALVVCPAAQETVKIRVKDEFLVRSFKDGRYYTVPKKELNAFVKETHGRQESNSTVLKTAVEKAISYLDKDELPPHWDRDVLFGTADLIVSDDQLSDSEASEEKERDKKDRFVAQLYKFMDDRGTPINKVPIVCSKDLDLYRLYNVVTEKGGYGKVSHASQWKPVTIKLGFGAMPSTSTINLVKQAYKKFLFDFEDFYKKLGCTIHTLSSAAGKPRNSRGVYRGGSVVPIAKESKKEEPEEPKKEVEEKEKEKKQPPPPVIEPETDSTSMDSDGKKSEQSDEPRRSRSRQEQKTAKKDLKDTSEDDKSPEKPTSTKKKNKKVVKEVEKEPVKEEPPIPKAEPPSPAPSQVSQGSKKGRGSRKRKEKPEEEPPVIEIPVEPEVVEGLSKDVKVQLGDKLRVYYPKGDKKVTYEAKVVDANEKNGSYLVHYTGWNNRYDEWIERDRISENASLRTDYQTKSQGKGPQTHNQTPNDSEGPKTPGGKGQKKKTTTPSAPTSSTGTRSKTGTIKRKRLSAEYEEPVKKKRVSKKAEKDAAVPSESESQTSESEPKNPPRSAISPDVSSASNSPVRALKAPKEKNVDHNTPSTSTNVKEPVVKGPSDPADKEKQNQKIDLIQIRSEMKGLDKIVKNKSPSHPTTTSTSVTPSQSPSSNLGQKMDIYEFEEDPNEAPKLKMFSPRSPDKKDDPTKPEALTTTTTTTKTTSPESTKPKEAVVSAVTTPTVVSVPIVLTPAKSETTSSTKNQPKVVLSPAIAVPVAPRPITPTSASQIAVTSLPSPSTTLTQPRAIVLATPTFSPRGSLQSEAPRIRMFIPATSPPRASRAPTAPPPLVPSSSVLVRGTSPSSGPGISPQVPITTPQHAAVPVLIPKPLGTPTLKHILPIVVPSTGTTPKQLIPAPKDAKLLPFITRKQELFPHLIQQQQPGTTLDPVSIITAEQQATTSHLLPISMQHDKVTTAPSVLAFTQHPIPQTANITHVPLPHMVPNIKSSADTKKEKKKRATPKKADLKRPPPPEIPVDKPPAKKRAKPGTAKAAKAAAAASAAQKTDPKQNDPPPSVAASTSKPSDVIPQAPVVAFKQSDHPRKIAVPKQSAASKSDKRTSPMKQNFLKGLASLEKEQRVETKHQTTKPIKAKTEEKSAPIPPPIIAPLTVLPQVHLQAPQLTSQPLPKETTSAAPIAFTSTKLTTTTTTAAAASTPSKSSVVIIESLPKTSFKSSQQQQLTQMQIDVENKMKAAQDLALLSTEVTIIPPQQQTPVRVEPEKKSVEQQQPIKPVAVSKEAPRSITPSFLTSKEEMEPEDPEELTTKSTKTVAANKSINEDVKKEEESCSSLLCEEEIPGSPAADDDEDKPRFDFSEEAEEKGVEKEVSEQPGASAGARVRGLPVSRLSESRSESSKKRSTLHSDALLPGVEKIPLGPSFSSVLADNTPPSTPESASLSTETGGSPHVDEGRISPSGEGASSKSKESTDGDSGDGSKPYYSAVDSARKSRKLSEPPPSPVNKRSRESRGRNLSPPAKRRRVPRRKSPEELSRPFSYRGGRSSSGRKGQSGSDTHEVVKAPPPAPPINLGKAPKSAKFNLIPDLDGMGIIDPDQRIGLIEQAMATIRAEFNKSKAKQQTIERRQKRRKKKERERAAERIARQEVAKIMAGS